MAKRGVKLYKLGISKVGIGAVLRRKGRESEMENLECDVMI